MPRKKTPDKLKWPPFRDHQGVIPAPVTRAAQAGADNVIFTRAEFKKFIEILEMEYDVKFGAFPDKDIQKIIYSGLKRGVIF